MTASEIVESANFHELLIALGFQRPKRGTRTQCALCNAKNPRTFSFDTNRGLWHCFRCDRGGGVLDLVQAAHGCERKAALRWLAEFVGVLLGRTTFSPAERRKYAKTRRRAEAWAEDLTDWCARIVAYLRARRHALWDTERLVSAWAREHLNDPSMANDWRWEVVYAHAFDNQRGDALNELIEQIEASSPMELAAMRRPWEAEAA